MGPEEELLFRNFQRLKGYMFDDEKESTTTSREQVSNAEKSVKER